MHSLLRICLAACLLGGAFCGGMARGQAAPGDDFPKAGLELWLSAAKVERTGDPITILKDQSGKGNDARRGASAPNTAANPALARDAASGQPVLRFSGADISFGFERLSDIRTAIWVVSKDPAAYGKRNEKFVLGDSSNSDFHAGWTDDTILNTAVAGHTSQYLHDGKCWLNGRPVDAKKTPFPKELGVITLISTAAVRANQVARDRNFSGRSWQGDIAEILLYNVELGDADRQAVEKYLIRKYAIKPSAVAQAASPAALPGKGLSQHDILYAGEWDTRKTSQSMFLVRGGRITWSFSIPIHPRPGVTQEFDDATLLKNGNIVFSRMSGAGMASPDKKRGWALRAWDAPADLGPATHIQLLDQADSVAEVACRP